MLLLNGLLCNTVTLQLLLLVVVMVLVVLIISPLPWHPAVTVLIVTGFVVIWLFFGNGGIGPKLRTSISSRNLWRFCSTWGGNCIVLKSTDKNDWIPGNKAVKTILEKGKIKNYWLTIK